MDAIADDLGLDPADVRRRNFIQAFPYTTATGLAYDSGDYGKALDRALELVRLRGLRVPAQGGVAAAAPTAASASRPTSRSAASRRAR